jgi:hypothetical protein
MRWRLPVLLVLVQAPGQREQVQAEEQQLQQQEQQPGDEQQA